MTTPPGDDGRFDDWLTPDGTWPERPTHVLAHLSDTHLTSAGVRYNKVLDADAALERAVAVLRSGADLGDHDKTKIVRVGPRTQQAAGGDQMVLGPGGVAQIE